MLIPVGKSVITKADANAKTVYVHKFEYDKKTKKISLESELVSITPELKQEENVSQIIAKWQAILEKKNTEFSTNTYDIIYVAKLHLLMFIPQKKGNWHWI